MFPRSGEKPVELKAFPRLCGVIDAVYNPLRTELVLEAKALGIKSSGGLYMLAAQAAKAEELFFGKEIPEEKTEKVYQKLFAEKENIVFSGMPGCGKSTLGKAVAERLGRAFYDIDALIEENEKKPIAKIFAEHGEAFFRALEKAEIAEASKKNGAVISLGGGAVLFPENVRALKQNGKIFFLNRPLEELCATESRPLSSDIKALEKRFNERFLTYCETADEVIEISSDINENTERILGKLK